MLLRDLARAHGRTIPSLGHTAEQVSCGAQRAGAKAIAAIAAQLGVPAPTVAAACDASWQAGQQRRARRVQATPQPVAAGAAPASTPVSRAW